MTIAALSLPIVALALSLGTAWVVAALLLPLWLRVAKHHAPLTRHTPLVTSLPWLAGATVALASILPGDPHIGQLLTCHCLESMPAWLHLCPVHPEEAGFLAIPAGAVLAALVPGRVRAFVELASEPAGRGGGGRPHVLALGAPLALLHGWLRPTLVIDQDLWAALSDGERAAVLAHERGHLRRRDPLVRMLLRVALVVAPRGLADQVARCWLDHAELAADAEAARLVGDPGLVAQALLRCVRLGARAPSLAVSWTGGALERRVHALLDDAPPALPARADVGLPELVVVTGVGVLALAAAPWVHHQVEHLLNLPL